MNSAKSLRLVFLASAAALALTACSDTTIDSPGAAAAPVSPPTAPPPPSPPATSTINLVPAAGCPTGTTSTTFAAIAADGFSSIDACAIGSATGTTTLTSDVSIPAGVTVAIQGPVFVGSDGGTSATLTLGAGAVLYGASASGTATATDDYLVVSRGSQIIVNGTEANPVRMTARAAINDENTSSTLIQTGTNAQWGGLVINGFAPINACIDGTAAGGSASCEKSGEGASGLFGGDQSADDSGSINYLIVEYAGARLTNDDELNGIAFQGVGSGTEVDFVQVHNNLDDGIEWFGGTVNASHVVITGAGDDSLDWTDGWVGKLQYAVVNSNIPTSGDPRGIEADNLNNANDSQPFSDPSISNFTLIGSAGNQGGIVLRRGTRGRVINGIVSGGYTPGLDIDNTQTYTNLGDGTLLVQSLFIDAAATLASDADDTDLATFAAANDIVGGNNSLADTYFPGSAELAIPASTALAADAFFDATTYIGAFSPTETEAANWATFALAGTLFPDVAATCPTGTTTSADPLDGKTLCLIPGGPLTSDLRLTDGDELIYELNGTVVVGSDLGPDPASPLPTGTSATLTIDPGVTIVAEGNDDFLIVTRGSQLVSNGTAASPVVFTAKGVVDGSVTATDSLKGVWGGLVINGRAPINACIDGTAVGGSVDCEKSGEGASGLFGGATSNDSSGRLTYTRVQYAGVRLTNDDELNGIAFQGVGSGTQVSYVQVSNNLDDGIEWFGGTVSADHIVIVGVGDDSLDWTDGWQGSLQYAIAYPGVAGTDGSMSGDPRGIEADNLNNANDSEPFSTPRLSNFTLINSGEPATQQGVLLRRGTRGTIANGIIVDWSVGLDVDDTQTFTNFGDGTLEIQSLFLDNTANFATDTDGVPTFVAGDNIVEGTNGLTGTTFVPGATGIVPSATEAGVTAFDVTGIGDLEATTYVGAVEDVNDTWFAGWTVDITGADVN